MWCLYFQMQNPPRYWPGAMGSEDVKTKRIFSDAERFLNVLKQNDKLMGRALKDNSDSEADSDIETVMLSDTQIGIQRQHAHKTSNTIFSSEVSKQILTSTKRKKSLNEIQKEKTKKKRENISLNVDSSESDDSNISSLTRDISTKHRKIDLRETPAPRAHMQTTRKAFAPKFVSTKKKNKTVKNNAKNNKKGKNEREMSVVGIDSNISNDSMFSSPFTIARLKENNTEEQREISKRMFHRIIFTPVSTSTKIRNKPIKERENQNKLEKELRSTLQKNYGSDENNDSIFSSQSVTQNAELKDANEVQIKEQISRTNSEKQKLNPVLESSQKIYELEKESIENNTLDTEIQNNDSDESDDSIFHFRGSTSITSRKADLSNTIRSPKHKSSTHSTFSQETVHTDQKYSSENFSNSETIPVQKTPNPEKVVERVQMKTVDDICQHLSEDYSSFKPPKLGFPNPITENCCWMNASLQIILRMKFLVVDIIKCYCHAKNSVICAFINLIKCYMMGTTEDLGISLGAFKHSLMEWNADFHTPRQQDASEFVSYFLSFLLNTQQIGQDSQLLQNIKSDVEITVQKAFICTSCKNICKVLSESTNTFLIYMDQTREGFSVQNGFDCQMKCEEAQHMCNLCDGKVATVEAFIKNPPKYLIIQIVRPTMANYPNKIQRDKLELTPYLKLKSWMETHSSDGLKNYQLTGIIYHLGESPAAGHYVADVFDETEETWLHFDDLNVSCKDTVSDETGNSTVLVYTLCKEEK